MLSLEERLSQKDGVILDGATGTELERRGFPLNGPGWSARAIEGAPDLLRSIHRDYVAAGADILTANTFRLHARNLAEWGREHDGEALVRQAVELAREAAESNALVGASLAPIGDCYSPELVPPAQIIEEEHAVLARLLQAAAADLILVETMVAIREALAASRAAARTGIPFLVSFVCGPEARLLSGESLHDAVLAVRDTSPTAICVNCVSVAHVEDALDVLAETTCSVPFGVYANTGERGPDGLWRVTTAAEPAVYAVHAAAWRSRGAKLIGGCCGTTPDHIRAIKHMLCE
jgi:homocysteine S-methyltransferase